MGPTAKAMAARPPKVSIRKKEIEIMAKKITTWGRKTLSMLLAMTMIMGMLQVSVLAASTGSADQIMNGYYEVGSNNTPAKEIKDTSTVTQDGYTLSKTIAPTDKENEFNITLTVQTSQTVVPSDAAIVLVIDNSVTMKYCGECGAEGCNKPGHNTTRLVAMKDILTGTGGFLEALLDAKNTGNIYVSVVSFGTNANTVCGWRDIKTAAGLKDVRDAIKNLKGDEYATNTHAGLTLARNLLTQKATATTKYTVLLSDGMANCVGNANSTSTTEVKLQGYGPSSAAGTEEARSAAATMAATLRGVERNTVYAVGYGVEKSYLDGIIGDSSKVYAGADKKTVTEGFKNVAQSAVSGMNGAGNTVVDPMGAYIDIDMSRANFAGTGATANGDTISWKLDLNKAQTSTSADGKTTTYTYTLTYPIKLDTSAVGFVENKYYPTNGYTYLNVLQEDGTSKPIAFRVPGVKGEIPEYDWTINYYLEDEDSINKKGDAKTYTLVDGDTQTGKADLHSSLNAPSGYADKYNSYGYHFAKADPLQVTIGADASQNVINLYYNLDVAEVTVKHFYKSTTITPAGETVVVDYTEDPAKTSTVFAIAGEDFVVAEQPVYGGVEYTFDYATPADKKVTVAAGGKYEIQLFYSRFDDLRDKTSARVDHVYETEAYVIDPATGKYKLETTSVTETGVQTGENLIVGSVYNVGTDLKAGYEGYVIDTTKGNYAGLVMEGGALGFVLEKDDAKNIRTLYFKKTATLPESITVTVNHHYTKYITYIDDNGVPQTIKNPDNFVSTVNYPIYKGESLTISEFKIHNGETYISDATNESKLDLGTVTQSATIDLYYELSVAPDTATAYASHYWYTITEATVEVKDADGKVIGFTTETREKLDHAEEDIAYTGLYEGQKHTEVPKTWGEGYDFDETSDVIAIAGTGDKAVLKYYKDATADERSDASVTVIHKYTTKLETIVAGAVETVTVDDGSDTKNYTGYKAGVTFTAEPQTTYGGNNYTRTTADAALSVMLQPGDSNVIVIEYVRQASDLVSTTYAVSYEYRTYTMTVNESGVAGYWDAPVVTGEEDAVSGSGYVGQKITLDPKAKTGFALVGTAPAASQTLEATGNSWTYVYEKYIPLEQGSVTVNHHYKTTTIAVNGTSSVSTQDVMGTPVVKYLGESYTAEAVLNGFDLVDVKIDNENRLARAIPEAVNVTVGENTVVDFYYEKTDDRSVPVTYSIAHEYYTYDWDGTLLSESKPAAVTGESFATLPLVAAPEYSDYTLTSATYNGADLGALAEGETSYTVTLKEGENKIVFVYEKRLARDYCDVTVIHNYFKDEAALAEGVTETKAQAIFEHQAEGSEFTAATRDVEGYEFHSVAPDMTITVKTEGENVIVINYVRKAASYEVIHVYQCNSVEEGRTSEVLSGLHGEVIDSESIALVESYNGNTYTLVSVSEDITLDSAAEVLPAIVITYNRTVRYNPPIVTPPTEDPVDPPVEEEEEFGEEDVPLTDLPEGGAGAPEEEIFEEDVPLADVPATGDMTALWAAASIVSAAGILFLGKKKDDEE